MFASLLLAAYIQSPPPQCYFVTGFLIPKAQYTSLSSELVKADVCSSSPIKYVEDSNDLSDKQDIPSSSSRLKALLPSGSKYENSILFGHSRGGAVAAYTAASLAADTIDRPVALVLIDPVDDTKLTTIEKISKSQSIPSTLIISTPFGGRSKYYKNAVFESSCAPTSRSSLAFFNAISMRSKENENEGLYRTTAGIDANEKKSMGKLSTKEDASLMLKEYKNIGHLQLLNDRQGNVLKNYFSHHLLLLLYSRLLLQQIYSQETQTYVPPTKRRRLICLKSEVK